MMRFSWGSWLNFLIQNFLKRRLHVALIHDVAGLKCVADGYVRSFPPLLISSGFFFPVVMDDMLLFAFRRLIDIVPRVVFVPSDFVADNSSVTFVSYYSGDDILVV